MIVIRRVFRIETNRLAVIIDGIFKPISAILRRQTAIVVAGRRFGIELNDRTILVYGFVELLFGEVRIATIDDRIGEFLSAEQMNQLLSTTAELQRELELFNTKIREALANKDFGFREVYIHCPLCGRVELVGSLRCSVCWTILRRCYDCGNYDRAFEKCGVTSAKIFISEAENPKDYSKSYKCPMYKPKFEALAVKLKMVA